MSVSTPENGDCACVLAKSCPSRAFANHVYPVDSAETSVARDFGQYRTPFTQLFGPERFEQVKVGRRLVVFICNRKI